MKELTVEIAEDLLRKMNRYAINDADMAIDFLLKKVTTIKLETSAFEKMEHDGHVFMCSIQNINTLDNEIGWYIDNQGYFQVIHIDSLYGSIIRNHFNFGGES